MATNYNINIRRYNGTDYDTLYPTTLPTNLIGTIPTAKITNGAITKEKLASGATYTALTVSLPATGWSNNTRTVNVSGVTISNLVLVSPAPASFTAYGENGIYCSAQGSGTLTFTCTSVPSSALTINVVILT